MSDPAFLFRRRHPDYLKHEAVWRHCADACRGGSDYLEKTLIRHVSEIDIEFSERKRRAYYFNYPRNIASRITQQVMAVSPVRSGADPALVEDWSRTGLRTNEVIRQLSNMLTVYGTAWIQVDAPSFQKPVSRKQAAAANLRPYVRLLSPLEVTDWSYGSDGKLEWALIREERYDSPDPFCEGSFRENIKLLEKGRWQSFGRRNGMIAENGSGVLPGEEIPLFKVTDNEGVREESSHWFEDMVRISEALAYADGIHNIFLREASSNSRKAGDEAPELQNIDVNEALRRENERLRAEIKQKEQIYENAIQIICNQSRRN